GGEGAGDGEAVGADEQGAGDRHAAGGGDVQGLAGGGRLNLKRVEHEGGIDVARGGGGGEQGVGGGVGDAEGRGGDGDDSAGVVVAGEVGDVVDGGEADGGAGGGAAGDGAVKQDRA